MLNDLEYYVKLSYSTMVVPDQTTDGKSCYLASHPELPGCMSHGRTTEEAVSNLEDAKRLYIQTLLAKGKELPLPVSKHTAILVSVSESVELKPILDTMLSPSFSSVSNPEISAMC